MFKECGVNYRKFSAGDRKEIVIDLSE